MKPFASLALILPLALSMPVLSTPILARTEAARSSKVPTLNVEASCRDAKIYGMTDPEQTYRSCMLDEKSAKEQLEKNWSSYKGKTRHDCLAAGAQPSPSYVELLTCIEMTEEILTPPKNAAGGGGAPTVPGGSLGSPPQRPLPSLGPRAMPR